MWLEIKEEITGLMKDYIKVISAKAIRFLEPHCK
jgi:hypothetical protein